MIDKWHTITMLGACDALGFHHTYLSSSIMRLFQKSLKLAFSFIEKWPRLVRSLISLDEKWCKACGTRWRKRKEGKKAKAIRPCSELKQKTESHSAIMRETQVRASGGAVRRDREKHSESVREWKRKMKYFSLLKLHIRKINW